MKHMHRIAVTFYIMGGTMLGMLWSSLGAQANAWQMPRNAPRKRKATGPSSAATTEIWVAGENLTIGSGRLTFGVVDLSIVGKHWTRIILRWRPWPMKLGQRGPLLATA